MKGLQYHDVHCGVHQHAHEPDLRYASPNLLAQITLDFGSTTKPHLVVTPSPRISYIDHMNAFHTRPQLTLAPTVIYGAHGLRRIRPHKDGGLLSTLALPYWGLISVGLLSGWFHATLKYHSQMGDDLSMFLAVGTLLHQLFTFDATPSRRRLVTTLILGTIIPVAVYHCWTDEIVAHEVLFGAMVILCGRKIRWLIKEKINSEASRKRLMSLATLASGTSPFRVCLHSSIYR